MCTLADKIITEILTDFKASKKYLDESQDTTSARARRCLNLVQNVTWLLARNADMIKASANATGWISKGVLDRYVNMEAL